MKRVNEKDKIPAVEACGPEFHPCRNTMRTYFTELSSDLHIYPVTHMPSPMHHTNTHTHTHRKREGGERERERKRDQNSNN